MVSSLAKLNARIYSVGVMPAVGEIQIFALPPVEAEEWLACDGGTVPPRYPTLNAMLNGKLPDPPPTPELWRQELAGKGELRRSKPDAQERGAHAFFCGADRRGRSGIGPPASRFIPMIQFRSVRGTMAVL